MLALRQAGVTDQRVTEALEKTPREPFVPRPFIDSAWENVELPIDCGQTLTRPVTVGVMLQALDARREHTVLEIGMRLGLCRRRAEPAGAARLFHRPLPHAGRPGAAGAGHAWALPRESKLRLADGLLGWPEAAPFDRVLLMGSVTELPRALASQLAPGGIVVAAGGPGGGPDDRPPGHASPTAVSAKLR